MKTQIYIIRIRDARAQNHTINSLAAKPFIQRSRIVQTAYRVLRTVLFCYPGFKPKTFVFAKCWIFINIFLLCYLNMFQLLSKNVACTFLMRKIKLLNYKNYYFFFFCDSQSDCCGARADRSQAFLSGAVADCSYFYFFK